MSSSLLLAPLGAGTVLSCLARRSLEAGCEGVMIIPALELCDGYERQCMDAAQGSVSVATSCALKAVLASFEPSDSLLLIDPRWFLADSVDLPGILREGQHHRWVQHFLTMRRDPEGAKERVHLDPEGRVKRIQRYYDDKMWRQTSGIACSLVPVASAQVAEDTSLPSLAELRHVLASRGVPSRDACLFDSTYELAEEGGFLNLSEHYIAAASKRPANAKYREWSKGVQVGERCRIHSSAKIFGPAIVQSDVTVGPGVVVIGPALLGNGAQMGDRAVIAQSVVLPGSRIAPGTVARHRVISGIEGRSPAGGDATRELPLDGDGMDLASLSSRAVRSFGLVNDAQIRSKYLVIKRMCDAIVAALAIIALAPLWLLIALIIKLDSRGPVLFGHEREGKEGRGFRCWKFRTMIDRAHTQQRALYQENLVDGPQFKLVDDPRITRIGRILRATNIDELPQLLNVLLGEMSLIGPRPSPFRENQICVPWRRARLSVRPGITGLWQICRHDRWAGDFHQWIYYDMLYVRHLSLWLDVKILLATVITLGGRWSVGLSSIIPLDKLDRPDDDNRRNDDNGFNGIARRNTAAQHQRQTSEVEF